MTTGIEIEHEGQSAEGLLERVFCLLKEAQGCPLFTALGWYFLRMRSWNCCCSHIVTMRGRSGMNANTMAEQKGEKNLVLKYIIGHQISHPGISEFPA